MPELALAIAVASLIALPHRLGLHAVAPSLAAAVWLLALALRALVGVGTALFVFVQLPETALFEAVARWCLHTVLPLLVDDLGLSGHSIADAATLLPILALTTSVLWVLSGLVRAAVALRLYLRRRSRGSGPLGSTVVDDPGIVVAVTVLGRPRLLVSRGALLLFDQQELAAGLAHELGHLRRGHRPILLAASVLGGLARPLPGTGVAQRELAFSLERDADEYALRQGRDPLALASAICKAAQGSRAELPALALGGRGQVALRLEYLLDEASRPRGIRVERYTRMLALAMVLTSLAVGAALPIYASASSSQPGSATHAELVCLH